MTISNILREKINKYKKYNSNIDWHIRTNKPAHEDVAVLSARIAGYQEMINDLVELFNIDAEIHATESVDDGNVVIAKFIGMEVSVGGGGITSFSLKDTPENRKLLLYGTGHYDYTHRCETWLKDGIRFHLSLDWLLAAIDNIESIDDPYHGRFGVHISSNSCCIQATNFRSSKPMSDPPYYFQEWVLEDKITSAWRAVVEFIIWYKNKLL